MSEQDEREALARVLHDLRLSDFENCEHGTNESGPNIGEPFAVCEREADAIFAAGWRRIGCANESDDASDLWHDEHERFERTGRLDQGPCWCPDCVEVPSE